MSEKMYTEPIGEYDSHEVKRMIEEAAGDVKKFSEIHRRRFNCAPILLTQAEVNALVAKGRKQVFMAIN